jgi:hypothetical protein
MVSPQAPPALAPVAVVDESGSVVSLDESLSLEQAPRTSTRASVKAMAGRVTVRAAVVRRMRIGPSRVDGMPHRT